MRIAWLLAIPLLLLLPGCFDRPLPGLAFGPGGRIIEVEPEQLRREAELIVEEAANEGLGPHWFASVDLVGLPIEDPDAAYGDRWYWPTAAIQVQCFGDDESAAIDLDALRQRCLATMARATRTTGAVSITIDRQILPAADFQAQWPTWRKHLAD